MQHALGQLGAAPHAAGERFDEVAGAVRQADGGEQLGGTALELGGAQPVEPALVAQVFGDGELLVEARRLEHDAHLSAHGRGVAADVVAEDGDGAALQRDQRRQQAEQRRLAAAVGAEEGEDLARGDLEAQVVDAPFASRSGAKRARSKWRPRRTSEGAFGEGGPGG